jgi:phosphoglucomutase
MLRRCSIACASAFAAGNMHSRDVNESSMTQVFHPLAGKPAPRSMLVDIDALLAAYDDEPDAGVPAQRISFGTSGHRGSSLTRTFNAWHVLAVTQAICDYRRGAGIEGPLFVGFDTHALSQPAFASVLEVLAANAVTTLVAPTGEFTPTPAVSLAIVDHNRAHAERPGDGIVITPSHNPPEYGGLKYNPLNGGPADTAITGWIQAQANRYLQLRLEGVRRMPFAQARSAASIREYDFVGRYVAALADAVDFEPIRAAGVRIGVDPLGGAGVHYWARIAERYRIDLDVVNAHVDPRFAFMTLDWDGRIRMDPSSACAMQGLIGLKDRYDVAVACDTDHDRHGVVAPSVGLMRANDYLSVLADHLLRTREHWPARAALGKTVVSTALLDRIAAARGRALYEAPVGFKWFAPGLLDGSLGFACEESAGASLLRRDGSAWTTDKDGIVAALLAAEMTAQRGRDPGELYGELTDTLGKPYSDRVDAPADAAQRKALGALHAADVHVETLAGEKVTAIIDRAPGNGAAIGGLRVNCASGWFAARPSGTEDIYKIYAESFRDEAHLRTLLDEAQRTVDAVLATNAGAPA